MRASEEGPDVQSGRSGRRDGLEQVVPVDARGAAEEPL